MISASSRNDKNESDKNDIPKPSGHANAWRAGSLGTGACLFAKWFPQLRQTASSIVVLLSISPYSTSGTFAYRPSFRCTLTVHDVIFSSLFISTALGSTHRRPDWTADAVFGAVCLSLHPCSSHVFVVLHKLHCEICGSPTGFSHPDGPVTGCNWPPKDPARFLIPLLHPPVTPLQRH